MKRNHITKAPPAETAEADSASSSAVDVTIIAVSFNTAHLLPRMFDCIQQATKSLRVQTIVVDNSSSDNSVDLIEQKYEWVELIKNTVNYGFGRANNQALACARGRYILLLNTDAFIEPNSLTSTIEFMEASPRVGILGVKLVGDSGELQPSCRYFPTPWNSFLLSTGLSAIFPRARLIDDFSWDHESIRACDWVPGCFYLIRRAVIDAIGLFDPRYFLYSEEVDHCRRAKNAGWEVIYFPGTSVVHIGGESALTQSPLTLAGRQISSMQIESELLYFRKHYGILGVLSALSLSFIESVLKLTTSAIRYRDIRRALPALERTLKLAQALLKTRIGTHPTR